MVEYDKLIYVICQDVKEYNNCLYSIIRFFKSIDIERINRRTKTVYFENGYTIKFKIFQFLPPAAKIIRTSLDERNIARAYENISMQKFRYILTGRAFDYFLSEIFNIVKTDKTITYTCKNYISDGTIDPSIFFKELEKYITEEMRYEPDKYDVPRRRSKLYGYYMKKKLREKAFSETKNLSIEEFEKFYI